MRLGTAFIVDRRRDGSLAKCQFAGQPRPDLVKTIGPDPTGWCASDLDAGRLLQRLLAG